MFDNYFVLINILEEVSGPASCSHSRSIEEASVLDRSSLLLVSLATSMGAALIIKHSDVNFRQELQTIIQKDIENSLFTPFVVTIECFFLCKSNE